MICPKCNTDNKHNFCIKCGYMINNNEEVQITYDELGKKQLETKKLKQYIGKDEYKVLNYSTNINAFIFGPFYYIYRKCYLIGFTFLILNLLVIMFFLKHNQQILLLYLIISSLFHFCFFNSIYIKICKKQIKSMQNVQEKGKSIIAPFLTLLLIVIIIYIIYLSK